MAFHILCVQSEISHLVHYFHCMLRMQKYSANSINTSFGDSMTDCVHASISPFAFTLVHDARNEFSSSNFWN